MKFESNEKVTQLQSQYMQQQERKEIIQKRRKKGLVRRLTLFTLLTVVLVGGVISALISQSSLVSKKFEEKESLQTELKNLEKEEKLLEEEIVKLNDDEYIAEIARRDYFLSDENEIIFNVKEGQ